MKGDFSRDTFDARRDYVRVLMQQGRVQVDADFNEQHAISHYMTRSLARDLIGPHGGPAGCLGFDCLTDARTFLRWRSLCQDVRATEKASADEDIDWTRDFLITPGRYYVDGMRLENQTIVRFSDCADRNAVDALAGADRSFVVYLEAFERVITAAEDPNLLDPALDGMDTSVRLQVQWHVTLQPCDVGISARELPLRSRVCHGLMTARTNPASSGSLGGYTGMENHLYRIEIHAGGETDTPSFKWSRDNGAAVRSVRQPVPAPTGNQLTLDLLPAIGVRSRQVPTDVGAFVELLPEFDPGPYVQGPLLRVVAVSSDLNSLKLDTDGAVVDTKRVRLLRCWGQPSSAIPVPGDKTPVALESGLEIIFDTATRSYLRAGDYWTIPARPSTRDIEWPRSGGTSKDAGRPLAKPPNGPRSASAPLGLLRKTDGQAGWTFIDARRRFGPLAI